MKNKLKNVILVLVCFAAVLLGLPAQKANAAANAGTVAVGTVDYDELTMEVKYNNNPIVFYSTNQTTWNEVEGIKTQDGKAIVMDISWISASAESTLYLKGSQATTIISVTFPARDNNLKVNFDKVNCDISFDNCDDAISFQWRKSSDYVWNTVPFETSSAAYINFANSIEGLLLKGAKIIFRTPQVMGKSETEPGIRPSKEVTVNLVKRANAPTVSVNAAKLTLNTTSRLEYYDEKARVWTECDKLMSIEDIAPAALYKNGGKTVSLMIRTAATASKTYSKTTYITIPGQEKAPTIGSSSADVSYYYQNKKLVLQFNNASASNIYSYTIVKPGNSLDLAKVNFVQIKTNKGKNLSLSTVPEGSIIYVRKQGVNANASKGINLQLSSELASFTVTYK